jgi:hypothetical protein
LLLCSKVENRWAAMELFREIDFIIKKQKLFKHYKI